MKILVIDNGSSALDFCIRAQACGHECVWYDKQDKDGSYPMAGKGIVPKLIDYESLRKKYIEWADLIWMTDNAHYTDLLEPYRKLGYPIVGPSPAAADLELNRRIGQEAMATAGLETIPGVAFDDYDKAAKYVEKHPSFLVSKPSGEADKALSYVADDAASLIYMFERWKKNDKYRHDAREHGFILQEKIEGVEMAVGGWFGPGGWMPFWYENFEEKKLMNGGLGPNTGEMGTTSMYVSKSKLADIALKPFTKLLTELEYVGFIDVSGMITDDGTFYPFEFTCRPGWPTYYNQTATHFNEDPAQWKVDLLNGHNTLKVALDTVCVSVVIAMPDFPYSKFTKKEVTGVPVYNADDMEHVHLCEVMLGDDVPVQVGDKIVRMPHYVTCGDYVAVVTGTGETITGARRSAYAAVKKIKIPNNPFYRTDIGSRLLKALPKVQRHGFAKQFTFAG
jgi:phosphoribosylamine---glycine ligase